MSLTGDAWEWLGVVVEIWFGGMWGGDFVREG